MTRQIKCSKCGADLTGTDPITIDGHYFCPACSQHVRMKAPKDFKEWCATGWHRRSLALSLRMEADNRLTAEARK